MSLFSTFIVFSIIAGILIILNVLITGSTITLCGLDLILCVLVVIIFELFIIGYLKFGNFKLISFNNLSILLSSNFSFSIKAFNIIKIQYELFNIFNKIN